MKTTGNRTWKHTTWLKDVVETRMPKYIKAFEALMKHKDLP